MLTRLLWNGKKVRIKLKTLKLPKEEGGFALPYLKNYYLAAQVQSIRIWVQENSTVKWRIETSQIENQSITIAFGTRENVTEKIENTWVNNSLKIWEKICKILKLDDDLLVLREIERDPEFKPNKTDKTFYSWKEKGLIFFGQFINDDVVISFEKLSQKYDLPNSHFFHYLQVRSYIGSSQLQSKTIKDVHPLIRLILKNKMPIFLIYYVMPSIYHFPDSRWRKWTEYGNLVN